MKRKFEREVRALGLPRERPATVPTAPVTEADLAPLPAAVARLLRATGVVGRPRDWSFRVAFTGRFRPSAESRWLPCVAWQYSTCTPVARIFYISLRMFGVLPVLGRDTYQDGRGRMRVRLLDLKTVADGQGEPFDIGELVTWLNDAVFIAPSFLLAPGVAFTAVDDDHFDVAVTDGGRTVRARVTLDASGLPADFETTDRFYAPPRTTAPPVRTRWTTPVSAWASHDGRMLWTRGTAVWHLPEGALPYADFTPRTDALAFNRAPGE